MAVQVTFSDPADAAHVVFALLDRAENESTARPLLARRLTALADQIGDALDEAIPVPSGHPTHTSVPSRRSS